jgi:hypothetical protein
MLFIVLSIQQVSELNEERDILVMRGGATARASLGGTALQDEAKNGGSWAWPSRLRLGRDCLQQPNKHQVGLRGRRHRSLLRRDHANETRQRRPARVDRVDILISIGGFS